VYLDQESKKKLNDKLCFKQAIFRTMLFLIINSRIAIVTGHPKRYLEPGIMDINRKCVESAKCCSLVIVNYY